jgi:dTDP-4-amino-4,6-dideoxygalactose transaminase
MELALLGGKPVRERPYPSWPDYGTEEAESLLSVLRSGSWGGYNEKVEEFEAAFAELHRVIHAVSCANGTVALEVVLKALDIGEGDEVIVPAITFISTASTVLLCRGWPIFTDVLPTSLSLSPAAVEAAITPRTKAIVAVHFGGQPADMDALSEIARRHGLALVEDAAHAHGALWRGTPVGNFGQAATFSFQAFKLVTSGEGGIILTNSRDLAERAWSYCNQGRRKGGGWFEHYSLGTNYRMTGFQAALLTVQLAKLPEQTRKRQANVALLRTLLKELPGLELHEDDARATSQPHYLVTLRYRSDAFGGVPRDLFLRALVAEGIPAQPSYPYPLYRNPMFRRENLPAWARRQEPPQPYESLFLPESEKFCADGIWLEHHLFLGDRRDVEDIVAAGKKIAQHAAKLRSCAGVPGTFCK